MLTLFRMLCGFIIAKMVAIYTGPTGLAFLGQFQSFTTSILGIVNAPLSNGLVRYTREYEVDGFLASSIWWKACVQWTSFILIIIVPIGCLFSGTLSSWIFSTDEYRWLVIITLTTLPFAALGSLVRSVLNGLQQYKTFIFLGITSIFVSTMLMIILIVKYKLEGALIAVAVQPALAGLIMFLFSLQQPWMKIKYWWGNTGTEQRKKTWKLYWYGDN